MAVTMLPDVDCLSHSISVLPSDRHSRCYKKLLHKYGVGKSDRQMALVSQTGGIAEHFSIHALYPHPCLSVGKCLTLCIMGCRALG